MADVALKQHRWIKIEITPVHVLANDEGEPTVFVDPDDPATTQYGCDFCSEPLNKQTIHTECSLDLGGSHEDGDIRDR